MNRAPSKHDDADDESPGFIRRFGIYIVVGVMLCVAGGMIFMLTRKSANGASAKPAEIVAIRPLPPIKNLPPPPPPPPQEKQEEKQEMMEQDPVASDEAKPAEEAPADASIGTGIKGNGTDGFGLGSGKGNSGGRKGGSKQSASKFGWWAAQVQTKIADVLRTHPKTRSANCNIKVRIWPDTTGTITKVRLVDSTGDKALDEALKNEILRGLKLTEPPPEGMPLPVVMRLRAQKTQ